MLYRSYYYSIMLAAMIAMPDEVIARKKYHITESGNNIILDGPSGRQKIWWADPELSYAKHYLIEVPLEDIDPRLLDKKDDPRNQKNETNITVVNQTQEKKNDEKKDDNEWDGEDDELDEKLEATKKVEPEEKVPLVKHDNSHQLEVHANYLYNRGNFLASFDLVDELIKLKPTYVKAWVMRGSLEWVMGHKHLAQKAWQKASELEPANQEIKTILERYK